MFDVKVFNSKSWLTWTFAWDIYDMIVSVCSKFTTSMVDLWLKYDNHHEFVHDIYYKKLFFSVYIYNRNGNFTT